MRTWWISHGRDGYSVTIADVPAWALLAEHLYDRVDRLTRHALCGGRFEFPFHVPLGWPKRDQDGYLNNSLGGWLLDVGTRALSLTDTRVRQQVEIPVSDAVGLKLWPDSAEWAIEDYVAQDDCG